MKKTKINTKKIPLLKKPDIVILAITIIIYGLALACVLVNSIRCWMTKEGDPKMDDFAKYVRYGMCGCLIVTMFLQLFVALFDRKISLMIPALLSATISALLIYALVEVYTATGNVDRFSSTLFTVFVWSDYPFVPYAVLILGLATPSTILLISAVYKHKTTR